jgi:hypothetical protein
LKKDTGINGKENITITYHFLVCQVKIYCTRERERKGERERANWAEVGAGAISWVKKKS